MSSRPHLPLARYAGDQLFLSALLFGSFVLLPRSSSWSRMSTTLSQQSSLDRPEHPFLTSLTARPGATMLWTLPGTWGCMIWWGQRLRGWWAAGPAAASKEQRIALTMKRFQEASMGTFVASIAMMLLLIGLGAPLDQYWLRTYALAVHLALLLAWPPIHALGLPSIHDNGIVDRYRMTRLLCSLQPENPLDTTIVFPSAGTVLGAWIGAAPIPLDWDRPWQSWPLTTAVGSLAGFVCGGAAVFMNVGTTESPAGSPAVASAASPETTRAGRRKAKKA